MRSSFKIFSWSKMSTYLGTVMSNCIKFLTFSLIPMWDLNPRPYVWGHLLIKSLYKNSPQNFRVTKVVCITFKCRNRDTSKKKSKEGKSLCTKMFHVAQVRKKLPVVIAAGWCGSSSSGCCARFNCICCVMWIPACCRSH